MTTDGALAGSIALVTGASGGIGGALAAALAAEGAQVQALARRPPAGATDYRWHAVDLEEEKAVERCTSVLADGLPVVVENDVVALTEAERWFGLGRGIDDFAVVTTGAGVGYGLVIHGRQVITRDTGLGLGGHFPLDPTGPICADGHRGCSTAMLSTTSMCASAAVGLGRLVSYEELLALGGTYAALVRER